MKELGRFVGARLGRLGVALVASLCLGGVVSTTAVADLPRTYEVVRADSPNPMANGRFGTTLVNVGDVNGDGLDELLTGTDKHGVQLGAGQVAVLAGSDPAGAPLRDYALPDVDPGGGGDRASGFGNALDMLPDLGSCPGFAGEPGEPCTASAVGAPDGVPEHIVAASGVDINPTTGEADPTLNNSLGVVYVFDGATGALLKRLLMPSDDRAEQVALAQDPRFGRAVLNPSGRSPCAGSAGIGACGPMNVAVRDGDLDGAGAGDILVAATDYSETKATAHPDSPCASQAGSLPCNGAGRVYVYRGEEIAGSDPSEVLDDGATKVKNRFSQPDDPDALSPFMNPEQFGEQLIPIGDTGRCDDADPEPGSVCQSRSGSGNDRPDFAVMAPGVDLFGFTQVGIGLQIDGEKLSVIKTTRYREAKEASGFGTAMNGTVRPALGDVAGTTHPDWYASDIQWGGNHEAQGRGFALSGNPGNQGSFREWMARFVDPTPQNSEQFGLSAAGVGDIFGDSRGEIAIGAMGPHNPGTNREVINDVHLFHPVTEEVLQTISAPDQQGGEAFGIAVQPMGDLNGDGFLDFAVGAGFYNLTQEEPPCSPAPCANAGRVYYFFSDDSPGPPPPDDSTRAGRTLEIEPTRSSVRPGGRVRIVGLLEAFAKEEVCVGDAEIAVQRRRPGNLSYNTVDMTETRADGSFVSKAIRQRATFIYRARVPRTDDCNGAVSNRERVRVR